MAKLRELTLTSAAFVAVLAAAAAWSQTQPARPTSSTVPTTAPVQAITPAAIPFDLTQVRLLDSPFKTAQQLNSKYILSLDPDRLLHTFRLNAKLPSNAKPLGGWEAPAIGLRGHFVGHYLSACALMYASTGDNVYRGRANYIVTELAKCQQAMGSGYLSAFPTSDFDTLESKFSGVWAPYYTIHKIMAGLLEVHQLCGNQQALTIATRMADYFDKRIARLTPEQVENLLHTNRHAPPNEFGGMSEVLHSLYAITHDPRHLKLADTFDRSWFIDPLASNQDQLAGLHANTHIPQVIGAARHYEVTGDATERDAAVNFWSMVTDHHSFVTGANSFNEHFAAPDVEAAQLAVNTAETCNVYNMLKLTRHLFEWKPDAAYADYYERALYNHILPSIDPDTGMTMYYMSLMPGHFQVYGTPLDSFWCCTGTGIENHAKYGDSIYFHSLDNASLWVNLFIPSELTWQQKGFTLRQETTFPQSPTTSLTIKAANPIKLAVKLRIPYWAGKDVAVKINGQPQSIEAKPQSYVTLDREWKNNDKIELTLPMSLRVYHAADLPNAVAFLYGPLVLAGELGTEALPASNLARDQNQFNKNPVPTAPALVRPTPDPTTSLKLVPGKPLEFTTVGIGKPRDVRMTPLYLLHRQRYTVYWKYSEVTSQIP